MVFSGFYSVIFQAARPTMNGIIALTNNGEVYGGDGEFVYSGTYSAHNGRFTAKLCVQAVVRDIVNPFGTTDSVFHLEFDGAFVSDFLKLTCVSPFGGSPLYVTARKVAELSV